MKSTVEQLNPTRVKVTVEVPFAELEADFAKAYKSLAGQVNISGFRPGKAPAKLLEARIGRPAVLEQVVNDMIPTRYSQAVDEHDLKVLAQPDIEVTRLEDGDVVVVSSKVVSKAAGLWADSSDRSAAVAAQSVRVVAERLAGDLTDRVHTESGLTQ